MWVSVHLYLCEFVGEKGPFVVLLCLCLRARTPFSFHTFNDTVYKVNKTSPAQALDLISLITHFNTASFCQGLLHSSIPLSVPLGRCPGRGRLGTGTP